MLQTQQRKILMQVMLIRIFFVCAPPPPPTTLYAPPSYRARVTTWLVSYYVKIVHVLLGSANYMSPLSWGGGGGHKRKRSAVN